MEKEKLNGLTLKQVEERQKKGQINKIDDDKTRSNWEIIRDNVCTLFNLFNLLIAIALVSVQAYTNLFYMVIIIINIVIGFIDIPPFFIIYHISLYFSIILQTFLLFFCVFYIVKYI